jgi:hypothetical protein
MDVQEVAARQAEGSNTITARMGALMLPLAASVLVVAEYLHPLSEDPMEFSAVFTEYAYSHVWIHLAEYFGFLLLLGGLVALYYSFSLRPGAGAGLAPFGLAAAATTAACFTVLQAVEEMSPGPRWRGRPVRGKGDTR